MSVKDTRKLVEKQKQEKKRIEKEKEENSNKEAQHLAFKRNADKQTKLQTAINELTLKHNEIIELIQGMKNNN